MNLQGVRLDLPANLHTGASWAIDTVHLKVSQDLLTTMLQLLPSQQSLVDLPPIWLQRRQQHEGKPLMFR
jgi:hypothetical protein